MTVFFRRINERITNLKKSVPSVWAAASLAVAQSVDAAAMLGQLILTTRYMTEGDFGVLSLGIAWMVAGSAFLDFRVAETITLSLPGMIKAQQPQRASGLVFGCLWIEVLGGAVTAIGLALLSPIAAIVLAKSSEHWPVFLLMGVTPLFLSIEEPLRAIVRLDRKFSLLSVWRAACGVLQFLFVWCSVSVSTNPSYVAFAMLLSWILRCLLLTWITKHSLDAMGLNPLGSRARIWARVSTIRHWRSLLSNSLYALSNRIAERADSLILGALSTPDVVAPYELARRIASQGQMLTLSIRQVIFPKMSFLHVDSQESYRKFLKTMTIALTIASPPVWMLGTALISVAMSVLFDNRYADSVLLVQLLLTIHLGTPLIWTRFHLMLNHRLWSTAMLSWACTIAMVGVCIVLVQYFGVIGAAVSNVGRKFVYLGILSALAFLHLRRKHQGTFE